MYSFMGGGLFCAGVGTLLLVVATATDHWMQYRLSGAFAHQGLWRYCVGHKCYLQTESMGELGGAWGSQPKDPGPRVFQDRPREGGGTSRLSSASWNATRALMILSALCAASGIALGILAFTQQPAFARLSRPFSASSMFFAATLFLLLALAIYTGVAVSFLGRRFRDWRFSWSYILGWVALLMTFFSGIFYMCAYRMHECQRLSTPR
ncbi:Lens fiber membrane intrinsic protein [Heterocephalus glaber]|uniref:Lens fiber membrane intrinsic protein n=1 Tax=Heterocephalus glaber TaxID=10181 RepID=G5BR89_HETGA|nr:Lens fiber membrane intrinsic protein [Heterocephalus glaber]